MLSLAERVDRTILRYSLLPPGARVIVALSGGADSTALLCLLAELAPRRGFAIAAAAHFNHGLRGAAAGEDEEFCQRLAQRLGIAWVRGSGDVRTFAARCGASLEDAARRLRYEFLHRAAVDGGATHVASGHTRDDQAETVLMQMARGAGPRGLRGMAPRRPLAAMSPGVTPETARQQHEPGEVRQSAGSDELVQLQRTGASDESSMAQPSGAGADLSTVQLVRPMLEVGHDELVAWLGERGQPFREDESNDDVRFLRNRVRHEVIPFLRSRLSPAISAVLARNAEIAASDAEFLDSLSAAAYGRLADVKANRIELDAAGLVREPDPIRRRVVLLALRNLGVTRFVGNEHVARVVGLCDRVTRGPLALPGARASFVDGRIVLERTDRGRTFATARTNFLASPLSIPGEARLAGVVISCLRRPWPGSDDLRVARRAGAEAVIDAATVSSLSVRTRRPGDWFRPLGMAGRRKKLQDYFVDRKVSRERRDGIPLVVDQSGRIVWVAGHTIGEEFRVREGTHDVVILRTRGDSF